MRKRIPILALLAALTLGSCSDQASVLSPDSGPLLELTRSATVPAPAGPLAAGATGDHLVVFKRLQIPAGFEEKVAALGGRVEMTAAPFGAATVSGLDGEAAAALARDPEVQGVEPERLILPEEPLAGAPPAEAGAPPLPASPAAPATAYFFPRQWNLRAIQADMAWAAGSLGSPAVTVAILDTGIGYTHADVAGLVDLGRSASFLPAEDALVQAYFPGAHPVADLGYHGTHVAATVSSNAYAAAGVTSRVTLMGVKVCYGAAGSGCPWGALVAGLLHAAAHGADVVNLSLAGGFLKSDYPGFVSVINRAFLQLNRLGVTVVVAAGNDGLDLDAYPNLYKTYCETPNTMCVSATGPTAQGGVNGPWTNVDAPAYYTNFGRSAIDVAAPGGNGSSSVWAACSAFSLVIPICQTGPYVVGLTGTSMATAHVSALAALAVESAGRNPGRVKALIRQSAEDLGDPGTDKLYGKGRVNAFRLVAPR
jgi:subtilisin family serine protease